MLKQQEGWICDGVGQIDSDFWCLTNYIIGCFLHFICQNVQKLYHNHWNGSKYMKFSWGILRVELHFLKNAKTTGN